jgi:hypothetical protein
MCVKKERVSDDTHETVSLRDTFQLMYSGVCYETRSKFYVLKCVIKRHVPANT